MPAIPEEEIREAERKELRTLFKEIEHGKGKPWREAFKEWAPCSLFFFTNKAEKQLRKLEPAIRLRVKELILVLEQTPVPADEYDLVKIAGEEDSYRIRLSSYRLVYRVYWEKKIIGVAKIERRSEATYD